MQHHFRPADQADAGLQAAGRDTRARPAGRPDAADRTAHPGNSRRTERHHRVAGVVIVPVAARLSRTSSHKPPVSRGRVCAAVGDHVKRRGLRPGYRPRRRCAPPVLPYHEIPDGRRPHHSVGLAFKPVIEPSDHHRVEVDGRRLPEVHFADPPGTLRSVGPGPYDQPLRLSGGRRAAVRQHAREVIDRQHQPVVPARDVQDRHVDFPVPLLKIEDILVMVVQPVMPDLPAAAGVLVGHVLKRQEPQGLLSILTGRLPRLGRRVRRGQTLAAPQVRAERPEEPLLHASGAQHAAQLPVRQPRGVPAVEHGDQVRRPG